MKHELTIQLEDQDSQGSRALSALERWRQEGYDDNLIVARALIALGDGRAPSDQTSALVASVKDILRQMRDLLAEMRALGMVAPATPAEQRVAKALDEDTSPQETVDLSQQFMAAVKKAARPGLRLDG